MTKILVIRFSSIGDIVLTTPLLRCLKNQMHDGVEIHYICKKEFAGLLEYNPHVSKIYTIEKSTREVADQIDSEQYDYFIDLHNNLRSRMLKRRHKVLDFKLSKLNWEKWLWVNLGINILPDKHIVDRYLETVKGFGIVNDQKDLEFYFNPNQQFQLDTYNLKSNAYVAWVIGAAHEGKRLSVLNTKKVLSHIDYPVALIGGAQDEELGTNISAEFENVINLAGKLNIDQSARVIKDAQLVVTPDTGMMHIAAAFKKNIISLWGCTVPGFGMYPYLPGANSIQIEPAGLRLRPCSKLGNRCYYRGKCINRIDTNSLISEIRKRC